MNIKKKYNTFYQIIPFLALVERNIQRRYLGTVLGVFWAFISPIITITLIYFVFTYGFRVGNIGQVSYFFWLAPGLLAWFYISDVLNSGCFSVIDNVHLVTKMKFRVSLLPLAMTVSPLLIHISLVFFLLVSALFFPIKISSTLFQLPYFMMCAALLTLAVSYVTSALAVFIRDVPNVMIALTQFIFWLTPIVWDPAMLSGSRFDFFLKSPFHYVINGYRDSFLGGELFWEKKIETAIFWILTLSLLFWGKRLFTRAQSHFADVL